MEKLRNLPSCTIEAMEKSVEDPELFGFVYKEHKDDILKQVRYFLRKPEDAEDVTQDVFEAAFKNRRIPVFNPNDDAPVLSWLRGITRRKIADYRRNLLGRSQRKPNLLHLEDVDFFLPSTTNDPASIFEIKDTVSSLANCFPENRRTIPYCIALGEKNKETSEELGITNARVSQIVNKARKTATVRKLI